MEPLRLAICDDLPEEREALLALLEQAPIATVCAQFASSEELLEAFRPGGFDLLLMDIYMDGMTGVEAVRKIREMDETIPIAFTTTSTEHTLESYRLSVLKYLEKPVRQKDINDLLHLVKLQRDSAPRLTVRQNGETQKIPLAELFYLEQKGHHVMLSRKDGSVLQLYGKLSDLLPQLEKEPKRYDFIILDPPAFTKSRKTVANAISGYKEINYRAMKLLPRGGILATCSCSHFATEEKFVAMLHSAAKDAGVQLRQIEARQQSCDHPILWGVEETNYLKFYLFKVV